MTATIQQKCTKTRGGDSNETVTIRYNELLHTNLTAYAEVKDTEINSVEELQAAVANGGKYTMPQQLVITENLSLNAPNDKPVTIKFNSTDTNNPDALKVTNGTSKDECTHVYAQIAKDETLKSAASCTSKAIYYESCEICGKLGTKTFEFGSLTEHAWKDATATTPKTCSVCGLTEGSVSTPAEPDEDIIISQNVAGSKEVIALEADKKVVPEGSKLNVSKIENGDMSPPMLQLSCFMYPFYYW